MNRPRWMTILWLVSFLVLSLAGSASAAASLGIAAVPRCGPLDFNAPNWPLCLTGLPDLGGIRHGRPPIPTVSIPTVALPTAVGTPGTGNGGGVAILCESLGNRGNVRCTINGKPLVINSPRGIVVRCSSVNNVLTCTFTVPGGSTATPPPAAATRTATPPATATITPSSTVTATTTEPPGATATATATASPSTTALPPPETVTAAPSLTAEPSATATMVMPGPSATTTSVAGAEATHMLARYNTARTAGGLHPVVLNDALMRSAPGYADLLNRDQVSFPNNDTRWHTYGGTTLAQRVEAAGCTTWTALGENIAVNNSVDAAFDAWFREGPPPAGSVNHSSNIMSSRSTQIGVGVAGRSVVVDHGSGC